MRLLSAALLVGGIVALLIDFPKAGGAMLLAGAIWWHLTPTPPQ